MLSLPCDVVDRIISFLPQSDVIALACSQKKFLEPCMRKLYRKIYVRRNPNLHDDGWFVESLRTEVSGLSSMFKREDQNDYLIYLKCAVLVESLAKYGHYVREFTIYDAVFTEDSDAECLGSVIDALKRFCPNIEKLNVFDERVKAFNTPSMKNCITDDLGEIAGLQPLESLTLKLHKYSEALNLPPLDKLASLKELIVVDEEFASLRLFKRLSDAGMAKLNLNRLVFDHTHGVNDYNTALRELTSEFIDNCIELSSLKELEMTVGCQEEGCACLRTFLDDIAPKLTSLEKVSFQEYTFQKDHYLTEEWDVDVGRFLLNIPSKIRYLSVRHNPPLDGKLLNALEGNYFRRRKLYENIVPHLKDLEVFICPTFLQSCACYEILPSDLLWNGCECSFCSKFLPLYDKYLQDHAYFDTDDGDFKDMISPRLFGLFGWELCHRMQNQYDLNALSTPPTVTYWDFHGFQHISCFNDVKECDFNKILFEPLAICVSHFMLDSVKFLVKNCPKLNTVVLTGIYFTVDSGEVRCVYDSEDTFVY